MFKGSNVALITPFKNNGLDEEAYIKLIHFHMDNGTSGLVPAGTTGESPTLSHKEHQRVIDLCIKESGGRIPVIAGTGSNSTEEAISLTTHAEKAGANGVLIVTPYYNKPTQEGLYQHYKAINDKCGIPIIIYNIPGRSVIDMSVDTMARLFELKNIIGVKDATGDLSRVPQQRITCGQDFIQLSGEDATALGFNAHGGIGCISVTANVAPRLCAQFQEATLKGDFATALKITDKLMPLHQAIFTEPGLCGAKYGLSLLGLCSTEVRAPLTQIHSETKTKIRDAMKFAGIL